MSVSLKSKNQMLIDLISSESKHQKNFFSKLNSQELDQSIGSGSVIGPLKPVSFIVGTGIVFRLQGYFCRYKKGDTIEVRELSSGDLKVIRASVSIIDIRVPSIGTIEIVTSVKKKFDFSLNGEYFFFPKEMSFFNSKLINMISSLDMNTGGRLKNFPSIFLPSNLISKLDLNNSQTEALGYLAKKGFNGCVQGPPGTGKTHLLKAVVAVALEKGLSVGIASFTHAAVDNALSKTINKNNAKQVVRIGADIKINSSLYRSSEIKNTCKSFNSLDRSYLVYGATLHAWVFSPKKPKVDLLIIDEAGQVPITFESFLNEIGDRLVLFGDHKQLPPVFSTEVKGLVHQDIFSSALSKEKCFMLLTQYRMNADIQSWSSSQFYNNKLVPDKTVVDRDILNNSDNVIIGDSRVSLNVHNGPSNMYANSNESNKVVQLVYELYKNGVPLDEIAIITPYRMQASMVWGGLQSKFGLEPVNKIYADNRRLISITNSITVDTVERLQGQEKEVVILSLGAESDECKIGRKAFLGDGRRLNVSITRAKSRFFCFSSKKLKNSADNLPSCNSYLSNFLSYCEEMSINKIKWPKKIA